MNAPTSLSVRELTKSYGRRRLGRDSFTVKAVDSVSFDVRSGETFALVGESGAGKSTVGRMALRLIEPDSGRVELLGTDLTRLGTRQMRAMRAKATMVFQDPFTSLNPRLLIRDAVIEPLAARGIGNKNDRLDKAADLLRRVGLDPTHLHRYPYEMSGGQLQRVAIARALITDPSFIVCDEPVAALDVSTQAQVINLLRDLQEERGLAYLFISHDLRLVRLLAERMAVMRGGAIVEQGLTEDVFNHPHSEYTRALIDAIPGRSPRERRFSLPNAPQGDRDEAVSRVG